MTVNITINSINGTDKYFVDIVTQTQVSPTSSNGIALLRYIPLEGGIYPDTESLISYSKFTVEIDFLELYYVNIYVSKIDPEDPGFVPETDWIKVGYYLSTSSYLEFRLLNTDFSAGDDIWIKVEDFNDSDVYDIKSSHIY